MTNVPSGLYAKPPESKEVLRKFVVTLEEGFMAEIWGIPRKCVFVYVCVCVRACVRVYERKSLQPLRP